MEYHQFPIFRDISEEDVARMMACFRMRRESYGSGEVICEYDGSGTEVGVVTTGTAQLVRIDVAGNRTVLEHLEAGGIFGEVLCFTSASGDSISIISGGCTVLYVDYGHIMKPCEKACQHHSQLVHNMFTLAADQIQQLGRRVEVLSRRSIRDKLLCYFSLQSGGRGAFVLPFTLSTLADYISTDRSAMMRELRKLREEGVIEVEGRKITLLDKKGA